MGWLLCEYANVNIITKYKESHGLSRIVCGDHESVRIGQPNDKPEALL